MTRSCGSCTLCCTVQGVKEGMPGTPSGEKLPNVPCPHAKIHAPSCGGCAIYESRPAECSGYSCMWLKGLGGTADRPDKVGVLFEVHDQEDPTRPFVAVRTLSRGREKNPRVQALISHLRGRGVTTIVVHPEDVRGWVTHLTVDEGVVSAPHRG